MKILEMHLGYRISFDQLEHVVYVRVENEAQYGRRDLAADDIWLVLGTSQGPATLEQVQSFYHVYPAPEEAVKGSIERAREEIAANNEKIARLQAALTKEAKSDGN